MEREYDGLEVGVEGKKVMVQGLTVSRIQLECLS